MSRFAEEERKSEVQGAVNLLPLLFQVVGQLHLTHRHWIWLGKAVSELCKVH